MGSCAAPNSFTFCWRLYIINYQELRISLMINLDGGGGRKVEESSVKSIENQLISSHFYFTPILHPPLEGNCTEIPTCEKQKKIEKIHAKKKQSHAQDNIYMVR